MNINARLMRFASFCGTLSQASSSRRVRLKPPISNRGRLAHTAAGVRQGDGRHLRLSLLATVDRCRTEAVGESGVEAAFVHCVSGDAKPRDFGGETRIGVSDAGIGATVGAGVLRIRRGSERRVVGRSAGGLG